MILEANGYVVDEAATGAEALVRMRANRPDLVLMDVMMANPLDGYYTTQKIADDPELCETPILMISSIADTQYVTAFPTDQYLNVVEFLSKPVKPEDLLAKVRLWAGE
ncbi:MAG: response regulator [Chloroflexia bacterium]|nr:response regulator [Chloroflexia bacterium]